MLESLQQQDIHKTLGKGQCPKSFLMLQKNNALLFILLFAVGNFAQAQTNLYFAGNGSGPTFAFGQVNLTDCSYCVEFEVDISTVGVVSDVLALPNGQVITVSVDGIIALFDPPSNTPLSILNTAGSNIFSSITQGPNGNIYITGLEVISGANVPALYQYNPATNTLTNVGPLPTNQGFYDLFYFNGQWYAFMYDLSTNPPILYFATVDFGPPISFNIQYTYPNGFCGAPTAVIPTGPFAGIYSGLLDPNCSGSEFYEFDPSDNSVEFICEMLGPSYPYGLSTVPASYPPPAAGCSCITDAGQLPNAPLADVCTNDLFNFSEAIQTVLDNDDILQYVLYSNPANLTGSILATSSTPDFSFNPALMQPGTVYYVAAIAGNGAGGNVSLSDPCFDFSNALEVIWRPLPSVTFIADNAAICPGQCTSVTATFTGTSPFDLTYSTSEGTFSVSFPNNSGAFQACIPVGTAAGGFQVQAIGLQDFFCSCSQ
jgi:hypothetical protein